MLINDAVMSRTPNCAEGLSVAQSVASDVCSFRFSFCLRRGDRIPPVTEMLNAFLHFV